MPQRELVTFDEELRQRGFQVEHLLNPGDDELLTKAAESDVVFLNMLMLPNMVLGSIRNLVAVHIRVVGDFLTVRDVLCVVVFFVRLCCELDSGRPLGCVSIVVKVPHLGGILGRRIQYQPRNLESG